MSAFDRKRINLLQIRFNRFIRRVVETSPGEDYLHNWHIEGWHGILQLCVTGGDAIDHYRSPSAAQIACVLSRCRHGSSGTTDGAYHLHRYSADLVPGMRGISQSN